MSDAHASLRFVTGPDLHQFRIGRIAQVDRVDAHAELTAVVGQAVGSEVPGVPFDRRGQQHGGLQNRPRTHRDVVDGEARVHAVAAIGLDGGEELSWDVDLQRFPGVPHWPRVKVGRRHGLGRVRGIDDDDALALLVCAIGGAVVGACVERRHLPRGAFTAELANQLEIAVVAALGAAGHPVGQGGLALQRGFDTVLATTGCLRHRPGPGAGRARRRPPLPRATRQGNHRTADCDERHNRQRPRRHKPRPSRHDRPPNGGSIYPGKVSAVGGSRASAGAIANLGGTPVLTPSTRFISSARISVCLEQPATS